MPNDYLYERPNIEHVTLVEQKITFHVGVNYNTLDLLSIGPTMAGPWRPIGIQPANDGIILGSELFLPAFAEAGVGTWLCSSMNST